MIDALSTRTLKLKDANNMIGTSSRSCPSQLMVPWKAAEPANMNAISGCIKGTIPEPGGWWNVHHHNGGMMHRTDVTVFQNSAIYGVTS
jgi:hypothetical protein